MVLTHNSANKSIIKFLIFRNPNDPHLETEQILQENILDDNIHKF